MLHGRILGSYIAIVAVVSTTLGGYVACGAQTYRIRVDNDTDNRRMTSSGSKVSALGDGGASNLMGVHSAEGWGKNIPIRFKTSKSFAQAHVDELLKAMASWEAAVGRPLFKNDGVDAHIGSDFASLYSPLDDSINSHYFDSDWTNKTGKSKMVLATTIWENAVSDEKIIAKADIRYNLESYIFGDSLIDYSQADRTIVDLQSLALHELGHLLGLSHISVEEDRYSVMNPSLFIGEGMITRRLSNGDIERIRSIYGVQDATLASALEKADDFSNTIPQ